MVRPEIIRKRLHKLDEYLSVLYGLQKYSFDEFVSNPERYGSAERFLQLAIEVISDLGNHMIANLNLGVVDWYSDIPKILAEHKYIDSVQQKSWTQMIGFRNILVHQYIDIDRKIVYDALQNNLEFVENLRKVFAQFL